MFVIDDVPELISESEVIDCQLWDSETRNMIKAITNSFKVKPHNISFDLWSMRKELNVKDNCLRNTKDRIFVPFTLRRKVMIVAHGNHHGETQTFECLKNSFFLA